MAFPWLAAAQAGGNILQGISGFFDNGGPGLHEQLVTQYNKQNEYAKPIAKNTAFGHITGLVEGARKNGIHPALAMGAGGGASPTAAIMGDGGKNKGAAISELGQAASRAAAAYQTKIQRELDELALERAKLENDHIKTQIAGSLQRLKSSGQSPAYSDTSSGSSLSPVKGLNSDRVTHLSSESVSHKKGDLGLEAGDTPFDKKFWLDNDTYIRLPPGQSIEDLGLPMSLFKSIELAYKKAKTWPKRRYREIKKKRGWK